MTISKEQLMNDIAAEQEKPSDALALVGLGAPGIPGYGGPDLLEEALSGELGAPSPHPTFKKAADFDQLNNQMRSNLNKPEPQIEDDEPPAPEPEPPAKKEDELPTYYHSLNDSVAQTRERLEQQMAQQRQQTEMLIQQLQRQQQPAQSQPEDRLYEHFGLESPEALNALEQRILAKQGQQMAPILAQIAQEKFENELAFAEKNLEHFGKHMNKDNLRNVFQQVLRSRPLQETLRINWRNELEQAYNVMEKPRLASENERLQKELDDLKKQLENKSDKKAEKAKLSVVPKASHQGSPVKASGKKDIDELDKKLSFNQFGREIWKRIGS